MAERPRSFVDLWVAVFWLTLMVELERQVLLALHYLPGVMSYGI